MGRAPRFQEPGAVLHITTRGVQRRPIFRDDDDRRLFIALVGQSVHRNRWTCVAYCLMQNHFHLLVSLRDENLSRGMHRLNGIYARRFNERYGLTGHLFEARFASRSVRTTRHMIAAASYIDLNPVRAGLCDDPADWPWSSFRAIAGLEPRPRFLAVGRVRRLFGGGREGADLYAAFVRERIRRA